MLMKLEKDRLIAKVENLEANLAQLVDADGGRGAAAAAKKSDASHLDLGGSPGKTQGSQISKKVPAMGSHGKRSSTDAFGATGKQIAQTKFGPIRKVDPPNPHMMEEYEPMTP